MIFLRVFFRQISIFENPHPYIIRQRIIYNLYLFFTYTDVSAIFEICWRETRRKTILYGI